MHNCSRIACILIVLSCSIVFAQPPTGGPNVGQPTNLGADKAWNDLQALTKPSAQSLVRGGRQPSPAERAAKIKQQVQQLQQLAGAARDFQLQNPGHPKVGEAKKIELIALLQGIEGSSNGQEKSTLTLAAAYRADKSIPAADRFDVALAQDRYNLSQRIKGKAVKDQSSEWLKLGDDLQKEFGDQAALQAYYLDIARRSDDATAVQIATAVARSQAAGPKVRDEAQSIVGRAAMVGKPLNLKLPKLHGGEVTLTQADKVTVLIVWSPSDPSGLAPLKSFPDGMPTGVQIVYYGIGKVSHILSQKEFMPLPGINCYSPNGPAGRTLSNALQLKYAPAPFVYVLDKTGRVAAYGRVKDLPVMLAKVLG